MNDYDISSIFKDMEDYLLSSMSRNMKRHTNWEEDEDFQWDMWQAKQLESLNEYRKQNNKYVKKQSNFIKLKIEELLKQSNEHGGMEAETKILDAIKNGYVPKRKLQGVGDSFFKVNERKLSALITSVNSDMTKATTAMLRMTNDEYRKTIFKAQVFANSGTATVNQAIDMATKEFLSRGINCIEYANGARVNIASYAEMAIKTANKRAYLQGEGSKRDEWGIHTVLVSRYGACSNTCLPYQGKVYIDNVWSGGTSEEAEALGLPLLSNAIEGGLFHPNCKHTMSTYFEGITTIPKAADVAGTRENSDVIATQRYNERNIRKYKRLENGTLDAQNKAQYGAKVKEWQAKQRKLMTAHPEVHRNYKRESLRGVTKVDTTADEVVKKKFVNDTTQTQTKKQISKSPIAETMETNDVMNYITLNKYKKMSDSEWITYRKSTYMSEDNIAGELAKELGYDAKPSVISEKNMNALVADGYPEVFRTINSSEQHDSSYYIDLFKNGDYYMSNGIHGSGTYVADLKEASESFSKDGSKTLRISIDKSAKIKTFKNNLEEKKWLMEDLKKYTNEYKGFMSNEGRNLMIQGYDAIYIEEKGYYVILNRGALYVQE